MKELQLEETAASDASHEGDRFTHEDLDGMAESIVLILLPCPVFGVMLLLSQACDWCHSCCRGIAQNAGGAIR